MVLASSIGSQVVRSFLQSYNGQNMTSFVKIENLLKTILTSEIYFTLMVDILQMIFHVP